MAIVVLPSDTSVHFAVWIREALYDFSVGCYVLKSKSFVRCLDADSFADLYPLPIYMTGKVVRDGYGCVSVQTDTDESLEEKKNFLARTFRKH